MAGASSTKLYDWGDGNGAIHKISKAQHVENVRAKNTPVKPPPGYYDPNLDAQEGAATRQLGYLGEDTTLGKTRALSDLEIGIKGADISKGRSLSDLLTAKTRAGEDYGTNIADLQRNYANLKTGQEGAQRKAGVQLGGAAAQATRKRTANEAHDRAPIDLAYDRFQKDNATAQTRVGEDYDWTKGGLVTNYQRGTDDLDTALERAGTENFFFGGDIAAARNQQATALGALPMTQTPRTITGQPGVTPQKATTLTAAPGLPGVTKKRKGRTVTYTASAGGP